MITNPCSQYVKVPLGKILSLKLPLMAIGVTPNNHTAPKYSMPLGRLREWVNVRIVVRCFAESVGFKGTLQIQVHTVK